MAAIDYWNIETTIGDIIVTELGSGSPVIVTIEVPQAMDSRPHVAIYLKNRTAPPDQSIAAATIQRYTLDFSIWCWGWSLDSPTASAEMRDDLVGEIEIILMKSRTMSGTINFGVLQGGEFGTAEAPGKGTMMGAEIIFQADVTATT